jgi:hypothetical protein
MAMVQALQTKLGPAWKNSSSWLVCLTALMFFSCPVRAQDTPAGPMTTAPEHHVTRIGTEVTPEAPPALPEAEIVARFSQKEDEYQSARNRYGFRRSIRIQEFGPDGKPSGEFLRVADVVPTGDGRILVKTIEKPQSTLQHVFLAPEDLDALDRLPVYPLTASQLSKYELKYLGKEQVDEIDCYIFQAKPKVVERQHSFFEGIVWVDAKYLEVVKTYGKWVTDLGGKRLMPQLPFSLFEIYRENVDGKYWIPNYARSDDTLHIKEGNFPMRMTIKWTEIKLPAAKAASAAPTAPPAAAPAAAAPDGAPPAKP